jgi:hypothetical protein
MAIVKIRLHGLKEDVEKALESLRNTFIIHSISKPYENRNSNYVRVYVDAETDV